MVQSTFLCATLVAAQTTAASAFVCAGLTGRISCSRYERTSLPSCVLLQLLAARGRW